MKKILHTIQLTITHLQEDCTAHTYKMHNIEYTSK